MNKIESLNGMAAVNLDEPLKDDLKRLSDENRRLVIENEHLKKILNDAIKDAEYILRILEKGKK